MFELLKRAVEVMKASGLGQAFGGRRLADFEALIAESRRPPRLATDREAFPPVSE